jgi:hypothetical protein
MAIGIEFDKEKAQRRLDAIARGQPLQPGPTGWTVHEMLEAAGALFFAALSHGPALRNGVDRPDAPKEHLEMDENLLFRDLHAALEFYGQLTMFVQDDRYDEQFEPRMRAVVAADGDGGESVVPVSGWKGTPDRI